MSAFMIFPSLFLMNVDPDAVLSVSMLDADAKVLIEMQEEDLRHRNSPGQAIQIYSIKLNQIQLPCFQFGLGYKKYNCIIDILLVKQNYTIMLLF